MRKDPARFCSDQCIEICDFCYFYDFNPGEMGCYIDKGYCRLHKRPEEPSNCCDKFVCGRVKEKEEIRR